MLIIDIRLSYLVEKHKHVACLHSCLGAIKDWMTSNFFKTKLLLVLNILLIVSFPVLDN